MAIDDENIIQEQEKLRLLNQQLLVQVASLQNNPMQVEGDPNNNRSPDLRTLDGLIQKRISKAKLLDYPTPSTKIHETPLFKKIQEYKFPKKFSTPTFDCYSGVNDPVLHIPTSGTRW